ncbi:hypothetical protein ABFS83_12G122700 [Erythranthe nasuta]
MQKKIILENKHGKKLVGLLHETRSNEVVIICHGVLCTKEHDIIVNVASALENEGISAFRFDFSGNGESEGLFQSGNFSNEVEDLRSVIEYFKELNRSTVAIIGHSKGGVVVLLYASKYHDITAVVNISGRFDLKRGLEERLGKTFLESLDKDGYIDVKTKTGEVDYRVTEESMMELLNTNMHEACLSIREGCRVLTVHGSDDEINPVEDAVEFDKIIRNHRLEIIRGANHGYTSHQEELVSAVLPFVKEL